MSGSAAGTSTAALRAAMVDRIAAAVPVSGAVEGVMRAVPRDRFLPGAPVEEAYADRAVAVDGDGRWAPAPSTVAVMLDQLAVRPGTRILEIGTVNAYSTALLSRLTGPSGAVRSTMDTGRAEIRASIAGLTAPGCANVTLVDDLRSWPHTPHERVLAHAGVDLRPALIEEVTEGGRLVIPLRLRGLERTVGFVRRGGQLVSESVRPLHVRPRGARRTAALLAAGVRLDAAGQDINVSRLRNSITGDRHLVETGVTVPASALAGLDLWLATVRPAYGTLYVEAITDQQNPVSPPSSQGVSAVWTDAEFAFVDVRSTGDAAEIRVAAYGPDRHRVADLLSYDIQIWDANRREGPDPVIRVCRTPMACEPHPPGRVITTPHAQILISWDWSGSPPHVETRPEAVPSASATSASVRWGVVTLDAHDRVVRAVVGFDRPDLANDWARNHPGVDAVVLPTEWMPGSDWAVVALGTAGQPIQVMARFPRRQAADLHARARALPGYAVVPVDLHVRPGWSLRQGHTPPSRPAHVITAATPPASARTCRPSHERAG